MGTANSQSRNGISQSVQEGHQLVSTTTASVQGLVVIKRAPKSSCSLLDLDLCQPVDQRILDAEDDVLEGPQLFDGQIFPQPR